MDILRAHQMGEQGLGAVAGLQQKEVGDFGRAARAARADAPGEGFGAMVDEAVQLGDEAGQHRRDPAVQGRRSEEHTSELQSLMRISYAVFCLNKKRTILYSNRTKAFLTSQ